MSPIRPAAHGALMVATAAIIWGTWSLFLKPAEALGPIPSITETWVVLSAAALFAWPVAWLRRTPRAPHTPPPTRASFALLTLSGMSDAVSTVLFFSAMANTTLAIANLTHYLAPIFVSLTAPWFLGRPFHLRTGAAITVAIIGLALLLQPWTTVSIGFVGPLFGVASAVLFAAHVLLSKHAGNHFSPYFSLAWQRSVAAIGLLPWAWEGMPDLLLGQWAYLAAGGALICGLAGVLFFSGLGRCRADQASTLTLLEPVSAVCLGWVVWSESLNMVAVIGIGLVLASVYVSGQAEPDAVIQEASP